MIETLRLLATYNREVNGKIHALLGDIADQSLLTRDSGAHFTSILGILHHIAVSDIRWFQRLHGKWPELRSLDADVVKADVDALRGNPYQELGSWWTARRELDEVFENLTQELNEEACRRELTYTNSQGRTRSPAIWQVLLHVFNHHTHHRGQVSQILDAEGVQHDYSNVMDLLNSRTPA